VSVAHATTWANQANLAPSFLADLKAAWEGRKKALQKQLEGLIVEDDDAELFHADWINVADVPEADIEHVAVGVDLSAGAWLVPCKAGRRHLPRGGARREIPPGLEDRETLKPRLQSLERELSELVERHAAALTYSRAGAPLQEAIALLRSDIRVMNTYAAVAQ
jgi:hypothetical protein